MKSPAGRANARIKRLARTYHVFLTPNGDCKGLYISNRTAASFEVHELGGGSSSVEFSYRIVALRKKYETVRFADHTHDPDPRQMMEHMNSARPQASPAAAPASAKKLALLSAPRNEAPGKTK
jgi:hypothetical protein